SLAAPSSPLSLFTRAKCGRGRQADPSLPPAVELRDRELFALSDDLAARDLGLVGHQRLELLIADPGVDELARLVALLTGLKEAEGAEDTVAGLDQKITLESRQLAQLRNESLVDLAGQLGGAILVHTVVAANGGMHGEAPLGSSIRAEESKTDSCDAQARCDRRRGRCKEPRRLQR